MRLPRWLRTRPQGRDVNALVRESGQPESLCALVLEVVKRTRLWRSEKLDVADELLGHFRDGLEAGADPEALAADFGPAAMVARLIRRAKRRQRPLAWRAWMRSMQGVAALLCLLLAVYLYAALRFSSGAPKISHDFLAEITAAARSIAPHDQAWPLYRAALLSLRDLPKEAWDAHPGDPGWPEAAAAVEAHAPALAMVREAAAQPGLGYVAGFTIDEADLILWPDFQDKAVPRAGLASVQLPHLAELRKLSRLLAVDMRRAAEAGDGALVVADFEAGLQVARHARELPLLINDLVSVAVVFKALDTLGEILAGLPQIFSEAQLHRLAHGVAALDRQRLRVRLDDEKMMFQDFVQHIYSDDANGDGHLTAEGLAWLDTAVAEMSPDPPDSRINVLAPVAAMVIAGRREMTETYDRLVDRAEARSAKPLWEQGPDLVDREVEDMQRSLFLRARYLLIPLLMPAFTKAGMQSEIAALQRDAVLVAIALELHHRRSGVWPVSLDELVPDLLPAVPPDRFDGNPLRYRLIDGRPLLYSIGWDRDDDGGKPAPGKPGQGRGDGDWVFWPAP